MFPIKKKGYSAFGANVSIFLCVCTARPSSRGLGGKYGVEDLVEGPL